MPASNAPDRSVELRNIVIVLWSVAMTATLLRVYVRVGIMKSFTLDDWLMLGAMASLTSFSTTAVLGTYYGSGRHWNVLDPDDAKTAMKYWWACYPSFAISMVLAKFSVGFFMLRIATQKLHRWIIYGAMCVTMISGICFFCVAVFQCNPVQFAWTKVIDPTTGTCLPMELIINMTILYSVFAIITDFTFTLLPAWLVWNLQMDKRTKFALIPILGMACVASSAVAVRFAYVHDFANPDFLWATTDIAIWSETEQALAITAGCFATLRPLFKIILSKLGFSQSNTANPNYYQGSDSHGLKGSSAYARSKGNTFASSKQSSKVGANSMFSMSTFTRLDDSDDGEVGKTGGRVEVEKKFTVTSSTTRLNELEDSGGDDDLPPRGVSGRSTDHAHVVRGNDGDYRVEIMARSPPK